MKLRIFIIFVVLTFLSGGSQTLLGQEGATPDRGNTAPADMLPDELQGLDIKDYFVSADAREAGIIQTMIGHVAVVHEDSNQVYFAAPGDKIFEKDVIFTLKESRCRLKFLDDNLITMSENTNVGVKEFITNLKLKEKKSVFSMVRGKAMFYALKLFKYRKASILVETPTAIAGVRGTKFGVAVRKVKVEPVASKPVYLADASGSGQIYLARANPTGTETIVYAFDGEIQVYSPVDKTTQSLQPGEKLALTETGAGIVDITPPSEARQFESSTEAPAPEGEEGVAEKEKTDEGEAEIESKAETGEEGIEEEPVDTTDVTQEQVTQESEKPSDPVTDPGTNASGTKVGYFSGMLTNQSDSRLEEIFVSTKRQDFDTPDIWARGSKDPSTDYIRALNDVEGSGLDNPYAKWVVFNSGSESSVDLGTNNPISHAELGNRGSYLEWGYWTMPDSVTIDNKTYLIDNRGYYIFGDDTSSMPTAGSATYSGDAYGTYWTSSGGVSMGVDLNEGEFTCKVDFATDTISDFDMQVRDTPTDASYTASILDGTASINADGTFSITNGDWRLKGTPPDHKMCHGSFYGTDADYIGGAWGMYKGTEGAVGIFEGAR